MTQPEPTPRALRQEVEDKIVALVRERLAHKQMTGDRAVQIAQMVLRMVPEDISDQELLDIIPRLDDQFTELISVVHDILLEQDEKMKAVVIPRLLTWLKAHRTNPAIKS